MFFEFLFVFVKLSQCAFESRIFEFLHFQFFPELKVSYVNKHKFHNYYFVKFLQDSSIISVNTGILTHY